MVCLECGGMVPEDVPVRRGPKRKTCGAACASVRQARRVAKDRIRSRDWNRKFRGKNFAQTPCWICGVTFTPRRGGQITCGSAECVKRSSDKRRYGTEAYRNNQLNSKHRRRERGEPDPTNPRERIRRRAIFDRDGWVCYLCAVPLTPPAREWLPTMATIDHVVPLARGGRHEESNLRACCARCNAVKSDKILA